MAISKTLKEAIIKWEAMDYASPDVRYNFVYKVFKQYHFPKLLPVIEQRELLHYQIIAMWKIKLNSIPAL